MKLLKNLVLIFLIISSKASFSQAIKTGYRTEITQYGITWQFDKPVLAGKFITGDWWVKGPVTIVK